MSVHRKALLETLRANGDLAMCGGCDVPASSKQTEEMDLIRSVLREKLANEDHEYRIHIQLRRPKFSPEYGRTPRRLHSLLVDDISPVICVTLLARIADGREVAARWWQYPTLTKTPTGDECATQYQHIVHRAKYDVRRALADVAELIAAEELVE